MIHKRQNISQIIKNNNGDKEDCNDKINNTQHGKPVDNLEKLHFSSETEIDASEECETKTSSKNDVQDDDRVNFEKTTLNILQNWILN